MANAAEVSQVDWEHKLYDVMDNVFAHLSVKDLNKMTKVCRSWREAALNEKAKRYYIQQLRLNCLKDKKAKSVEVKHHASILVYDSSSALEMKKVKDYVHNNLKKKSPTKVIVLKVKKCLSTRDVQWTDPQRAGPKGDCTFLGLFLPNVKGRLRIRVAYESTEVMLSSIVNRVDYLAEELCLRRGPRPKSTILIFSHSRRGFELAEGLMRNRIQRTDTVWMGMTQELPISVMCNRENYSTNRCIVAVRISGPSVSSWGATIDSRLPREELERQLVELKGKVRRRRHCTGLFYSPAANAYGDGNQITSNIKRIFPDVPFVGLFNSKLWSGADSFFELPHDVYLRTMNFLTIIIISYD